MPTLSAPATRGLRFRAKVYILTVAAVLLSSLLWSRPLQCQVAGASTLNFDVVSVKPNKSGSGSIHIYSPPAGDGMILDNVTLMDVIGFAYDIQNFNRLSGLPEWAKTEHFTIQARVSAGDVTAFRQLNESGRKAMLQRLLAQTFLMKSHMEPGEIPVFALVVAKGGVKMSDSTKASSDGSAQHEPGLNGLGRGKMAGYSISMRDFAPALSGMAGRQVVDRTELKGTYNFTLTWAPENSAPDVDAPSLFTALEEQLGLKLQPEKMTMPILVVDSVTRPED